MTNEQIRFINTLKSQGLSDAEIAEIVNNPEILNSIGFGGAFNNAPTQNAIEDAANGGTPGIFARLKGGISKNGGGTMKEGFKLPTLNQSFGNANLGYSLGGGFYANDAKRFLTPDEINLFKSGQAIEGIDPNNVMKTDAGLNAGGYQLGKLWTAGQGALNAIQAVKNVDNLNKASEQGSDLKADLLATAASTPNVSSYLTADEQKMLNQLKRGNYYEGDWGSDLSDYGGVLSGGVKGALAGAPGGIPGMILGGLGGAVNGGLKSATKKKETQNSKLDALYNTLNYARNDYNSMKRPNFSGLGVQQRFRNAYM